LCVCKNLEEKKPEIRRTRWAGVSK